VPKNRKNYTIIEGDEEATVDALDTDKRYGADVVVSVCNGVLTVTVHAFTGTHTWTSHDLTVPLCDKDEDEDTCENEEEGDA